MELLLLILMTPLAILLLSLLLWAKDSDKNESNQ